MMKDQVETTIAQNYDNPSSNLIIIKLIFFYLFFFMLFYIEPLQIAGIKIGVLWKIIFLFVVSPMILLYVYKTKKIEYFIFFAILLSLKMFFNLSSLSHLNSTIGLVAKNLMFPILFIFLYIKFTPNQLILYAKHFSILFILSFIPFLLGVLEPLGSGYNLKQFGFENAFGLVGIFQKPHSASMTLAVSLIVIFYFFQNEKNKILKVSFLCLMVLGLYELFLTYVRTGLLMAFIGIFYLWWKQKGSSKLITIFAFVLPSIFLTYYIYITNPVFQMRIHDQTKYSITSGQKREIGSGRLVFAKTAIKNWYEEGEISWLIGLGYEYGLDKMEKSIHNRIFAHNWYVQMLQQEGIIGILLFFGYLFSLLMYILKYKNNKYYNISMAFMLAYLADMLVQGGFLFPMFLLFSIFLVLLKKTTTETIKS